MYLIGHLGKAFDNDAFQRVRLGAIVLMTSVSIPMIWQGDEFGEARQLGNDNQHLKKFPMQWLLMEKEQNRNLYKIFKRLIELRRTILNKEKYNKINFFYENSDHRILAYTRSNNTDNEDIVIITNFADQIQNEYEIKNFPHNGQWIDWLTNDMYSVNNSVIKLDLKPFDGKILLRQK
jgi:1,4-alpha-glucan branching enzyme